MSVLEDILKRNVKPTAMPAAHDGVQTQKPMVPESEVRFENDNTPNFSTGGKASAPAKEVTQPKSAAQPSTAAQGSQFNVQKVQAKPFEAPGVAQVKMPTPAVTGAGAQPNSAAQSGPTSYVEMLEKLNPHKVLTPEEREQQMKREKRDKTFAAIGDGISALANLYYTTQGAPNSYNPQNTMSGKTRAMWDKINKERDDNYKSYLNFYMQAAKADRDAANTERSWQNTLAMQKQAQENADRNFEAQEEHRKWQREEAERQANERKADKEREQKNKDRQFNEGVRQFNVTNSRLKETAKMRANGSGRGSKPNQYKMALGNGKFATVGNDAMNAHNVGYVYNRLPEEVRKEFQRKHIGKKATQDEILDLIGQYVETNQAVRAAWQEVGGEIVDESEDWSSYEAGTDGEIDWSNFVQ